MTTDRYPALDAVRGMAVMGILAMNIIAFSMPEAAYVNPMAWGHEGRADLVTWAIAFVLVDGKMRGLFSLLFGASMLLVYSRAEAAGNGLGVHVRRMGWLLVFGLAHHFLIWDGDILALYALCGLVAIPMLDLEESSLKRLAGILFVSGFLTVAILVLMLYGVPTDSNDASHLSDYQEMVRELGGAGPSAFATEAARYRSGWTTIAGYRLAEDWDGPIDLIIGYGAETLAFFASGMVLLRNGFLTGDWSMARYRLTMAICYAGGLLPLGLLVTHVVASGFDAVTVTSVALAWSMPFRVLVTFGHAALAIMLWKRFAGRALMRRVEAAGRTAFTNYLGTSVLMTTLFYGYGLALFGHVSRWQAYLICVPAWALMLLWPKPWLERFRYGPMEWLWRCLARRQWVALRR